MERVYDWCRPQEYDYFDLLEYIDKIVLNEKVLLQLMEVGQKFEEYLRKLKEISGFEDNRDAYGLIYDWLDNSMNELRESAAIEKHNFTFANKDLINGDLFFDRTDLNHERIKKIHRFVCANSETNEGILVGEYRKKPAIIGKQNKDGRKNIYWYGVKYHDIFQYMHAYIEFYKERKLSPLYYNPFLKSALAHMLFVRIQPFGDGNRRTARIIHNITFTSEINKFYGTSLKLSPLNISSNIRINQITYADRLNKIKFNMEEDTNDEINAWFSFILNMYEEQLFYQSNRLKELERKFKTLTLRDSTILEKASKSKINKLL